MIVDIVILMGIMIVLKVLPVKKIVICVECADIIKGRLSMACQNCKICDKEEDSDFVCIYVDRDCFDGCDYCLDINGEVVGNCKYEGG